MIIVKNDDYLTANNTDPFGKTQGSRLIKDMEAFLTAGSQLSGDIAVDKMVGYLKLKQTPCSLQAANKEQID